MQSANLARLTKLTFKLVTKLRKAMGLNFCHRILSLVFRLSAPRWSFDYSVLLTIGPGQLVIGDTTHLKGGSLTEVCTIRGYSGKVKINFSYLTIPVITLRAGNSAK